MSGPERHTPDASRENPGEYGFINLLRVLERRNGDKPRVGRSQRVRDEIARLGQDPFLAFPETDLSEVDKARAVPSVRARFMGFFGAHGALPLNTTEEVMRWVEAGDRAFVEFTDLFLTRFLQLYFRSWSDAHPIAQFDHPGDDRYASYLLGMAGIGTPAFRDLDKTDDILKLGLSALAAGRVKSPVRLRQMLSLVLSADVEVEENVPLWMPFEPDSLSALGTQGSTLGQNVTLGEKVCSVNEKICLHIQVANYDAYRRFLPGGPDHARLADITFWYLGRTIDVDVALWLPSTEVRASVIGQAGELGWTASVAPDAGEEGTFVPGARYRLEPEHKNAPPLREAA